MRRPETQKRKNAESAKSQIQMVKVEREAAEVGDVAGDEAEEATGQHISNAKKHKGNVGQAPQAKCMDANPRHKRPREFQQLVNHGPSSDDEMFESCNEGEPSEVEEPKYKRTSISDKEGIEQRRGKCVE